MRCWDIPAALYAMFICAILGWSTPGQAHSWYPHECCSDRDCSAVEPTTIKETAEGFHVLPRGDFVERGKERQSPDGAYHVCRYPSGKLICLFVPSRGS
jgi:hypothetical protein